MPKPLIAGNWKMNGLAASLVESEALATELTEQRVHCDVLLCPPHTLIHRMQQSLANSSVAVGAQDCHAKASGAHTGDTSVAMLADAGATAVIVGHSERRTNHDETSPDVRAKAEAVVAGGLTAIICIGETGAQRDAGQTLTIVLGQLAESMPDSANASNIVIAYEPVWAIGTGRTPTVADVATVHLAIRDALMQRLGDGDGVRILYGGSVKPDNAQELLAVPHVNGALVGGASLKAKDFVSIIRAFAGLAILETASPRSTPIGERQYRLRP
jgi:triosephosphate isomerase (TIM)